MNLKKIMALIYDQTNSLLQRLKEAAEKAKIELSSTDTNRNVNLPFITADKTGPKHVLTLKFTRAKLEALVERIE